MSREKSQEKSVAMKRASTRQWVLKPQDLAIAFKLAANKGRWLPYAELGAAMYLSRFEAHAAVQRLIAARLFVEFEGVHAYFCEHFYAVLIAFRHFFVIFDVFQQFCAGF